MKTLTRILSSFSLLLILAYSAHSQDVFKVAPVGIGSVTPTQALDVTGSVKFSGALMPFNAPGTPGYILVSGGTTNPPTWLGNGTSGEVLTSTGTGAPTWVTPNIGSVTSIITGAGLTGGPITSSGTIVLANGTAAAQVFVTGATPFTPALQALSQDAIITSAGAITVQGIQTIPVSATAPTTTNVLGYNGTQWAPTTGGVAGQVLTFSTSGSPWAAAGYWNITGNAGTNPAVDFIGTTNDFPLVFYTDKAAGISYDDYAGQIDPQYENSGATLKGNTYMGGGSPNEANFTLVGGGDNDAGSYNVGFGSGALGQNTTGIGNVAVGGYFTLILNTTGNYNVALDRGLESNYAGSGSIGIGFDALAGQSGTASYNIGIGYEAGFVYLNGASGSGSSLPSAIGNFNSAVGNYALYINNATNDAVSNTAIGNYAAYATTGKQNTVVGDSALFTNISGNHNTALGFNANVNGSAYTNATAIGANATASASNSIALGNSSATSVYLPGYNSVGSLYYTSANTGLVASLAPATSGWYLISNGTGSAPTWANVSPTSGTVTNITSTAPITITTSGAWIVGIQGTGSNQGGVLYSTGSGTSAFFTTTGAAGQRLTSNGSGAPYWAAPSNALWSLTGNSGTTPGTNWIGTNDDEQLRFYSGSPYAGPAGSIDPQFVGGIAKANTYLGDPNGNNSQYEGAGNNDAGSYNVAFGFGCMGFATSAATYDVAMGRNALEPINDGAMSGSYDVSMGGSSNDYTLSGNYETAIGWSSMAGGVYNSTTSNYNTAAGALALSANNTNGAVYYQAYNTALGYKALLTPSAGTANSNTGVGTYAGYQSTGSRNTAAGDSALYTNTTGAHNTALGYGANVASAALTNATVIGYAATATVSNSITLGNTAATSLYVPGYNTVGSLLYTSANTGLVASLTPSTSGYVLQSQGTGTVPTWANVSSGGGGGITSVSGNSPIVVSGTYGSWAVGIQGSSSGLDKGGVLYSTGSGTSAVFTSTGTATQVLQSNGTNAPSWVASPTVQAWFITGNSGTTPGVNFIGTNDANRLVFKIDGNASGTIDLPSPTGNGNVYYGYDITTDAGSNNVAVGALVVPGSGTQNIFTGHTAAGSASATSVTHDDIGIGYDALKVLSSGIDNTSVYSGSTGPGITTGSYNTGAGFSSLDNSAGNYIGVYNTGIGQQTLNAGSVLLSSNTAVGYQSQGGTEANHNTSFGSGALEIFGASGGGIMTGTYNTAVGDSVFYINTGSPTWTGNYNTGLGWLAEVGAESGTGGFTNATSIGARSDANTNNSMVLGTINLTNGATANTNVGIGTNTPAADAALAIKTNHFETQGQLTSSNVVLGTGAGTGGSAGTSIGAGGATDVAGEISFTTGTSGLAAGSQILVYFNTSYIYSPIVSFSPANSTAAAMVSNGAYITSNPGGFSINFTTAPSANTTYCFNYYAVETPGTSPIYTYPSYTENCYVPITITTGSTAVAAGSSQSNGFQQMITVNSSIYSNENASLNNIVFTTAAPVGGVTQGTVLTAWIESGNSSASTGTVYWVNLGTNGIGANSSITIYMNMVSTNVLSSSGPTGEAPQLSSTYAQYDNGSLVFNNYWNFAGTSTPSGITTVVGSGGTITFNNGLTITNTGTPSGTYLYTTSATAEGNVAESYFIQKSYPTEGATYAQALLASMVVNTSTSLGSSGSTTSYAGDVILQMGQSASGGITVPIDVWNFEIQDAFNIAATFPPPALAYESANFGENIWSLGITPTGTLGFADVNYTNLVSGGSSVKNLSAGFYTGLTLTQGTALYQWLRTRTYPPGGAMPTAVASTPYCTLTPQANVCYVPITVTNSQTTAVAAGTTAINGYQEMLTVNSSNYTSYESAGLQNVEFTVGAPAGQAGSTQLNSWLESGNSNVSGSTVYWLNLGTNGITASGGTLTVYMNFMTSNILSSGPSPCAGEAPQLSGTTYPSYGEYDNGALVFNNYWNFAESSPTSTPPSGLTSANATGGQITFNNGLTINPLPSVAWGTYVATSSKINEGNVAESYFEQESFPESTTSQALLAGMVVDATQNLSGTTSYSGSISLQTGQDGVTVPLDAFLFEIQNAYVQPGFPYPVLGYETYNTNLNVWSLGVNTTGTLGFGDVNYSNLVSGGSASESLSSGFYIGLSLTQESAYYQWLRTRTYPPNGVMPPITNIGSVTCL